MNFKIINIAWIGLLILSCTPDSKRHMDLSYCSEEFDKIINEIPEKGNSLSLIWKVEDSTGVIAYSVVDLDFLKKKELPSGNRLPLIKEGPRSFFSEEGLSVRNENVIDGELQYKVYFYTDLTFVQSEINPYSRKLVDTLSLKSNDAFIRYNENRRFLFEDGYIHTGTFSDEINTEILLKRDIGFSYFFLVRKEENMLVINPLFNSDKNIDHENKLKNILENQSFHVEGLKISCEILAFNQN